VTALHCPTDRAELVGRLGRVPRRWPAAPGCSPSRNWSCTPWFDLTGLGWPSLRSTDAGLEIGATCTLAELAAFAAPPGWPAAALARSCCEALAGSFKIWPHRHRRGNICLGLPAGPMTSLAAALDGELELWPASGPARRVPVTRVVRAR